MRPDIPSCCFFISSVVSSPSFCFLIFLSVFFFLFLPKLEAADSPGAIYLSLAVLLHLGASMPAPMCTMRSGGRSSFGIASRALRVSVAHHTPAMPGRASMIFSSAFSMAFRKASRPRPRKNYPTTAWPALDRACGAVRPKAEGKASGDLTMAEARLRDARGFTLCISRPEHPTPLSFLGIWHQIQ